MAKARSGARVISRLALHPTVLLLTTLELGMARAFIDVCMGDREEHSRSQAAYDATTILLAKHASIYGLPASPAELSEEQQDILRELDVHVFQSVSQ